MGAHHLKHDSRRSSREVQPHTLAKDELQLPASKGMQIHALEPLFCYVLFSFSTVLIFNEQRVK